MPVDVDEYRALSTLILSATIDWSQWTVALDRMRGMVPGASIHLFGYDLTTGDPLISSESGYAPDMVDAFKSYYGQINPWSARLINSPVGLVQSTAELCDPNVLMKTEFYADWVLPQNDILRGGGAVIGRSDTTLSVLGANIESRRDDACEEGFLSMLNLLVPLIQRSWDIGLTLVKSRVEHSLMEQSATTGSGLALVTEDGRVRFRNRIASDLLEAGRVLKTDLSGRLTFAAPRARALYRGMLDDVRNAPLGASIDVDDENGTHRLTILPFDPSYLQGWDLGLFLGIQGPSLLIIVSPPVSPPASASLYMRSFGLTNAELEVAHLLAQGVPAAEIAIQRSTTYNTVRNQIRAIAEKLGVHRQTEIAAMFNRGRRSPLL